jgi:hypothetical protein
LLIVVSGKGLLDFLDECRKGAPFFSEIRNFFQREYGLVPVGQFEPLTQGGFVSIIPWKHAHQKVKMVVHETESNDFSEIDAGKMKNQGLQPVLVGGRERKPGQG